MREAFPHGGHGADPALTLPATLLYNVSVPEKVTARRAEILKGLGGTLLHIR